MKNVPGAWYKKSSDYNVDKTNGEGNTWGNRFFL